MFQKEYDDVCDMAYAMNDTMRNTYLWFYFFVQSTDEQNTEHLIDAPS